MQHIPTDEQRADIFTKTLPAPRFLALRDTITSKHVTQAARANANPVGIWGGQEVRSYTSILQITHRISKTTDTIYKQVSHPRGVQLFSLFLYFHGTSSAQHVYPRVYVFLSMLRMFLLSNFLLRLFLLSNSISRVNFCSFPYCLFVNMF